MIIFPPTLNFLGHETRKKKPYLPTLFHKRVQQETQGCHQVLKVLKSLEWLWVLFPTSKGSWIDFEVLKNQQIAQKNSDTLFLYALFIENGPLPFGFDFDVPV